MPIYRKAYTIGKYRNFYLKDWFMESNPEIKAETLPVVYRDYYNNYKEELYNNYMKDKNQNKG